MDFNTKIKYCLENILKEKKDIFLIDFDIRSNDSMKIVIDGDNGIKVQDCIKISKAIKSKIEEENKNFSIEVTSPGIGENLKISRQYKNNVGRDLELKLDDGTFIDGKLKKANDKKIELEILETNSKIKTKKYSRIANESYYYKEIKQARLKVKFKN